MTTLTSQQASQLIESLARPVRPEPAPPRGASEECQRVFHNARTAFVGGRFVESGASTGT